MRHDPERLWRTTGFRATGVRRRLNDVRAVLSRDGEPIGLYIRTSRLRSHAVVVPLAAIVGIDEVQRTVTIDELELGRGSEARRSRP